MICNECKSSLFSSQIAFGSSGGSKGGGSTVNKTPGQIVNRVGKGDFERRFSVWDHLPNVQIGYSNKDGFSGNISVNTSGCRACHK